MALVHPRHAAMEEAPSSPAASSPSFRRLRKSFTDKLERFCSSPSSQTTRSSSVSSQPFEEEPPISTTDLLTRDSRRAHLKRLRRIEAVRVEHSIRKHDHRYYVVYVYLKSRRTPIYRRDPDYELDVPYVSFFSLRDSVLRSSCDHAKYCASCAARTTILREHHENAHDFRRLVRTTHAKQQRLEKFLHCLLADSGDAVAPDAVDADITCDGCAATFHTLAEFLKRQYQPSTGII